MLLIDDMGLLPLLSVQCLSSPDFRGNHVTLFHSTFDFNGARHVLSELVILLFLLTKLTSDRAQRRYLVALFIPNQYVVRVLAFSVAVASYPDIIPSKHGTGFSR